MALPCEACGKQATMQCPKCKDAGVAVPSRFCTQECFKAAWVNHKEKVHLTTPLSLGRAFLAKKQTEEGVQALQSGVLFKVLQRSQRENPRSPKIDNDCTVHYRGTLIDGTEFDSSLNAEPVTFKPNQVIAGWTECLQLMTEGTKWEVYIPFELAYGPDGSPPSIPGHSALIFTIELLSVSGKSKGAEAAEERLSKSLAK